MSATVHYLTPAARDYLEHIMPIVSRQLPECFGAQPDSRVHEAYVWDLCETPTVAELAGDCIDQYGVAFTFQVIWDPSKEEFTPQSFYVDNTLSLYGD